MKLSLKKLPALYDVLYSLFALGVLIAAVSVTLPKGFTLTGVGSLLMTWADRIWWFAIPGILLHLLSYFSSLMIRGVLIGNIIGICGFITFILVPNYGVLGIVLLMIAARVIIVATNRFMRHTLSAEVHV